MTEYEPQATERGFEKPPLSKLIAALRQESRSSDGVVSSTVVYGLSDLSPDEKREVGELWRRLPSTFKHQVLRALNQASEAMFELSYREIAQLSLVDDSAMVREKAVELLWTDETAETMRQLIDFAERDPDHTVRASALNGLGRFILLGEYGDVPADLSKRAQDLSLSIHQDPAEPLDVRRRALEALSNSSHPLVTNLIRSAYANGNHDLKISALFAMGRSCNKLWRDILMEELASADDECVYEAIQACGRIQLAESLPGIAEISVSGDGEIQLMAIWALGEIGGKRAVEILSSLVEAEEDEELALVIDEALDTASFSLSFASLGFDLEDG